MAETIREDLYNGYAREFGHPPESGITIIKPACEQTWPFKMHGLASFNLPLSSYPETFLIDTFLLQDAKLA